MKKLTNDLKKEIIQYIERNDPNHELIKEITPNQDFKGGKIRYNESKLTLHRKITKLIDEEYVRAFLVTKLVNEFKYKPEFIELEKEYSAGRPKIIKPRIDVIVRDKKDNVFLFIESKSPDKFETDKDYIEGQLFDLSKLEGGPKKVKYLVYYSIGDKLEDNSLIIDYTKNETYDTWFENGLISLDRLPKNYGIAKKAVYVNKLYEELKNEEKELDRTLSKNDLLHLRDTLLDVLWGGGEMFYNEIFSNLVKLFLAKIFDEETTHHGKPYRFQIEFENGHQESHEQIYKKINLLFKEAQKLYLGFSDEMVEESVGIDKEKIKEKTVAFVVESLQGISLLENENKDEGDILGDFFEGIISKGFKQDKGQFFTHGNIVRFILYALKIDQLAIDLVNGKENPAKPRLPFICDPSCGSGTFLIDAMKLITSRINKNHTLLSDSIVVKRFLGTNFPDFKENSWAREYIYGIEKNSDLALATKVNMVLHGDGSINIFAKDGLLPFREYELQTKVSILSKNESHINYNYPYPVNEGFDVVVSNPPFAIPLDKNAKKENANFFMFAEKPNSENLFVERWYQLLKEKGFLGVVLPESFFDTSNNSYIRLFLYKYFKIIGIVSIPGGKDGAFQPYTGTKTNLLFAQKKSKEDVEQFESLWDSCLEEYEEIKDKIKDIRNGKLDEDEAKEIIKRYLRHLLVDEDLKLDASDLLKKYAGEITLVGRNSEWWIFGEVSRDLDYQILMASAEEIGYKRVIRGKEHSKNNSLFDLDDENEISFDIDNPVKILDYFRGGKIPENNPEIFSINFSEISKSLSLRLDVRIYKYLKFELPKTFEKYKYKVQPLRNAIISVRNGKDIKKDDYSDDETYYMYPTVNNIKPEKLNLDDVVYIDPSVGERLSKFKLDKNDFIITRSGTVGVSKVFDVDNENVYIPSGYLIVLKIDEDIIKGKFLELFLNSDLMKPYFQVFGVGKSQKNITQTDVKNIPIPIIKEEEQLKIISEINPLLSEIQEKENEIQELRDKVKTNFNGKLIDV